MSEIFSYLPKWLKRITVAGAVTGVMCIPLFLIKLVDGHSTKVMDNAMAILLCFSMLCFSVLIIAVVLYAILEIIADLWDDCKYEAKNYVQDTVREELEEFGEEMRDYIDYALELKEQKNEYDENLL